MENKSHAFWTGLFTVGLGMAIVAALFWFNRDRTERLPYDLIARTNVTGLAPGARVRYRGLPVGKVETLRLDRTTPGQILIRILVDTDAPVTRSTFATLAYQGVTGMGFIQLDDTGADSAPLPTSLAHVAQLPLRPGMLDELQRRGETLLQDFSAVAQSLHQMLDARTQEQVRTTLGSVEQAARSITTLTQAAAPALAEVPQTLANVNRTLSSTQQLLAGLNDPKGPFANNLDKIGNAAQSGAQALAHTDRIVQALSAQVADETLPRLNALADDVRSATRAFDSAAGRLGHGPSRLLFGRPPSEPGPGEPGFAWPAAPAR